MAILTSENKSSHFPIVFILLYQNLLRLGLKENIYLVVQADRRITLLLAVALHLFN